MIYKLGSYYKSNAASLYNKNFLKFLIGTGNHLTASMFPHAFLLLFFTPKYPL